MVGRPVLTIGVLALDLLAGDKGRRTHHAHHGRCRIPVTGGGRKHGSGSRLGGIEEGHAERIRIRIPVRIGHGIGDDDLLVERVSRDDQGGKQQPIIPLLIVGIWPVQETDFIEGGPSSWACIFRRYLQERIVTGIVLCIGRARQHNRIADLGTIAIENNKHLFGVRKKVH